MSYQVLARKWRPKNLTEVIGQSHVVQALTNALKQQRLHHAYLLTGKHGTGKTTIARVIAKCMNCEKGILATPCDECNTCHEIDEGRFIDLIEVDAASRTKVEDTRELLENVQYAPSAGRFKVYLIDEVHMLSGHSFNALLKTLEEPPPHIKFLLATTDPQKLPETVLSRCLQFHLKNLLPDQIQEQLQHVLTQENVTFEPHALTQLAKAASGSMRDALSLLDQAIAYGDGKVNVMHVNAMLGTMEDTHLFSLVEALTKQNAKRLLEISNKLAQATTSFADALAKLMTLLHAVTVIQAIPEASLPDWPEESVQALATQLTAEEVQLYYQIALIGQRDLPLAPDPKTGFEMVLLRMLAFKPHYKNMTTTPTAIAAQSQPQKAAASKPAAGDSRWETLLSELNLTGSSYAIASHCTLAKLTENTVKLVLEPSQKPLLTKKLQDRLSQAFSQHFGRPISVDIEVNKSSMATTPAAKENKARQQRQQTAQQAIEKDANVKALIEAFDAKIVPGSVTANED